MRLSRADTIHRSTRNVPDTILVLFAHPAYQRSQANRRMVESITDLDGVTLRDLYEEYPDFNVDVAEEQKLLDAHDIIVFQHPLYWYSCPALLKEWLDLVLEFGYAFGPEGVALRGKRLLSAVTTGGSTEAYSRDGVNRYTMQELLVPFAQTAHFCGMQYLPPFVVHDTLRERAEDQLDDMAADYRHALIALRDGTLVADTLSQIAYLNDALPSKHKHERP